MRFRRRSADDPAVEAADDAQPDASSAEETAPGPVGPYDAEDLPAEDVERVDLGSLLVPPEQGRELRLQVDEKTGNVQAVLLAGVDGALEIRAFAAPRNGDLWGDVRPQIAADMARRGGTATEQEGTFGTELHCRMPVRRPDGSAATQPSRIVGLNGSRWLLRGTFLGRPATEPEAAEAWERTLRTVAVRRGDHAMPVGEPLPIVLPDNARRVTPPTA